MQAYRAVFVCVIWLAKLEIALGWLALGLYVAGVIEQFSLSVCFTNVVVLLSAMKAHEDGQRENGSDISSGSLRHGPIVRGISFLFLTLSTLISAAILFNVFTGRSFIPTP